MEHATDNRLIWLDLEMTGLDPDRDRIIEIATHEFEAQVNEPRVQHVGLAVVTDLANAAVEELAPHPPSGFATLMSRLALHNLISAPPFAGPYP